MYKQVWNMHKHVQHFYNLYVFQFLMIAIDDVDLFIGNVKMIDGIMPAVCCVPIAYTHRY